jgi:hypothetical protein
MFRLSANGFASADNNHSVWQKLPSEMAHGHAHTALHARLATAKKSYCFS